MIKKFRNAIGAIGFRYRHDLEQVRSKLENFKEANTNQGVSFSGILKYGKSFLGSFWPIKVRTGQGNFFASIILGKHESPVFFALSRQVPGHRHPKMIGWIALAFEKNAVLIETIQGEKWEKPGLDTFSQTVSVPWANFLVNQIERHARKLGFSEVKIRYPETLENYKFPATWGTKKTTKEIQRIMKHFILKVAETASYSERSGDYIVKKI